MMQSSKRILNNGNAATENALYKVTTLKEKKNH